MPLAAPRCSILQGRTTHRTGGGRGTIADNDGVGSSSTAILAKVIAAKNQEQFEMVDKENASVITPSKSALPKVVPSPLKKFAGLGNRI